MNITKTNLAINASEARMIADETNKVNSNLIFEEIRKVALVGNYSLNYSLTAKMALPCNLPKIISELKHAGFTVKEEKGNDKDGDSWCRLTISW